MSHQRQGAGEPGQHRLAIAHVAGRGIPLRGRDIDTDRIMPARFLRAVSFDGLDKHLFEDDRAADSSHSFNNPNYVGAAVLVVNANFGCGSSREHAPQGLARAGIKVIIGESYSEIFRGNAAVIGLPCLEADRASVEQLQALIEARPQTVIDADIATGHIDAGGIHMEARLPAALRDAFLSGQWNPTALLLERFEEVEAVAARLPYLRGFV
jgi:3-isopropylmalate/(R)-2-methylmalate dehydratase small subunit